MLLPILTILLSAAAQIEARAFARNAVVIERGEASNTTYDYIIAGGGLAGLTLADRLTENLAVTVLVVEAGPFDQGEDAILVPGKYNPSAYFWFNSISPPQPGLLSQAFFVIMGKVVGGGSAINAMFMHRPAAEEMSSWETLGAKGWGFNDLLPYYKKSETFTPPDPTFAEQHNISYAASNHGSNGPIYTSYAAYDYPGGGNWWTAAMNLGQKKAVDINGGAAVGLFYFFRALNPFTGTRSYSKTGHYDRVIATRPNYHLLPSTLVSKVTFNGTRATGVEIMDPTTLVKTNAYAKKEVIVSAGGVHTPQILQLSGIGPKALLESLNIPVVVDLPGVGANFQDQPSLAIGYNFDNNLIPNGGSLADNATYLAEQQAIYDSTKKGALTMIATTGNQGLALSLQNATTNYQSIIAHAKAQNPADIYASGTHPDVLRGYAAQRAQQYAQLASKGSPVGSVFWNTGPETSIYMLKPLSRGTCNINSNDITASPVVDFRTLSDDTDLEFILALFNKNREIMQQPSIQILGPTETTPANGETDVEMLKLALRGAIQPSTAHQCCTTPMMKRKYGGVVDRKMLVYGTKGLSVVGVSMFPLTIGSAPSATLYAAAEKAADIIMKRNHT
ncbi:choline dehydrogenase-like protein [Amylocarpus encephaloides]|uniref:Choline dehydrogenase-like protein n=1 Tax=Amylocarpus encephaloides TaxID=45428 RepID=A0A9P7YF57_9HELO|nr:choline dehydrogenase-like protein [Amylocarpus encephaloides]